MTRSPAPYYRDVQRNRALFRKAWQITAGILALAGTWVLAVIIMSGGPR